MRDYAVATDVGSAPVRTLAVCSGKGGVGKTSVSINLSAALARAHKQVMLLDADLAMANADVLLGVKPQGNLSHVLSGEKSLREIICDAPAGIKLVPASSGVTRLANLTPAENAGLIHAFSELDDPLDLLIIDVAAGIADSVVMFTRAAQEVLVVVCDEPASLTDAYALIKVLSQEQRVTRFNVLCNQVPNSRRGEGLFKKLQGVCDRFLDVHLTHLGNVPADDYLRRAVQMQRPVVEAFPSSRSARAFREIASRLLKQRPVDQPWGGVEFFLERLVGGG
jgi:flagellar biosynthesis protein FlhG